MKKRILYILILFSVSFQLRPETETLNQYKAELLKRYKPENSWVYLKWDRSFSLKYESPESFLKTPTCIKINQERIFITDNLQHNLKVYSKEGDFLKSIGQLGKGPSDLLYPYWLGFENGNLLIKSNNGIDIFDTTFKFKDRIRIFLTYKKFFVIKNHIYFGFYGTYQGKYPFFVKNDLHGKFIKQVFEEDIEKNDFLKKIKADIFIGFSGDKFFVLPMHWNKIYIYNENLDLIKKIKVNYSLLDKIEKWNDIPDCNKKKNSSRIWPSNIIAEFKIFEGKLYLFLDLPRLEILVLDFNGNIETHFFNEKDFKSMWWKGFEVQREKEGIVFYILGCSFADDKPEMNDFNVYRMVQVNER